MTSSGMQSPLEQTETSSNVNTAHGMRKRSSWTDPHTMKPGEAKRVITMAELALHNNSSDAWIAIRNKVYDITKFAQEHPGGPVIFTYAGKDATDVFGAFHEAQTWHRLPDLCIGEFKAEGPATNLVQDFREMKAEMMKRGMYQASPLFYTYKVSTTLGLLGLGMLITAYGNYNAAFVVLGAVLTGLFWQQCGWLAHDFCHNQVFKARWLNHWIGGYFLGNVCQGFSAYWWKYKHNKHHAAPNECDSEYNPVDPDIDTLPFLAWSEEILDKVESKSLRKVLAYQSQLLMPLLAVARLSWLRSSVTFAFSDEVPEKARPIERATLVAHYAWVFGFAFGVLPPQLALLWLVVAEIVGGFLLGFVFVQSHNAMEVYNEEKDFYTAQIISTRDVKESVVNNWFSGGLNRQIEHHLFPTMPRHHLKQASFMVEALCKKHGLVYEDVDWATGTIRVLTHLAKVAANA